MKQFRKGILSIVCTLALLYTLVIPAQAADTMFYDCVLYLFGFNDVPEVVTQSVAIQVQAADGSDGVWAVASVLVAQGADGVGLGAEGACWDLERDRLLDQAAEQLDRLCPTAAAAGVKLLLMPVLGPDAPLAAQSPVLGPAEEIMDVIRRVDSPWLGACLDTSAMSVWGDDIPGWFARLGTCTHLVRLCDGNYHGWRAWGEGCLPMDRYLEQLEAAGYRGELSLLVPGERYVDRPGHPLRQALAALRTGGRT